MNIKLKPPCRVTIAGKPGWFYLRHVTHPNRRMVAEGWKGGLVAAVQNEKGMGVVEYRKCRAYEAERS